MGSLGTTGYILGDCGVGCAQHQGWLRWSLYQYIHWAVGGPPHDHAQLPTAGLQNVLIYIPIRSPIIQTLCLILYCSSPIMFLSFMVFIMNMLIRSFFINLAMGVFALLFTLRCNLNYFKQLNAAEKQLLSLYPVLLFYTFITLFISMIWARKIIEEWFVCALLFCFIFYVLCFVLFEYWYKW